MVAVGLQFLAVNGWRADKTVADDEASFAVRPGRVIGFLGPNGEGNALARAAGSTGPRRANRGGLLVRWHLTPPDLAITTITRTPQPGWREAATGVFAGL